MSNKSILILHLEGLLQSYGGQTHWEYRVSDYIPSKSSVIGLLGSALGIPKNDKRLKELSANLSMAVRVDRQGEMFSEYQTIRGKLYNANGTLIAEGRDKVTGFVSKQSKRQYLQDATFVVALEGEDELLKQCEKALRNPVWHIYLGRKCCVPSRPLLDKENAIIRNYKDIDDVMQNYPLTERHDAVETIMYQVEDIQGDKVRYDETLARVGEKYSPRLVRDEYNKVRGDY